MSWIVGVDVGGTFTDLFAVNLASGRKHRHKRPSTPANPAEAILRGLAELGDGVDLSEGGAASLRHGTTVATNALIQRRGGAVALVVTSGFRDLLEIGRQTRPHMFSLQQDRAEPLAPRERRFEAIERVGSRGQVVTPLSAEQADALVDQCVAAKVDAVAIGLLFSFLNPEHETALKQAFRRRAPDLYVSVSSDVQPEFREFERLSTTVLNAYLQPVMDTYLSTLRDGVPASIDATDIGIYQSSGGLMSIDNAIDYPVRTALSGPAAGAVGAVEAGRRSGVGDIVTLDMGGTSADVCLIEGGRVALSFERSVAGFDVRLPMVDIHTVGAGGGSIAWFDRDGLLKVGPQSAGAVPGPACYARGGQLPTVTDANMVLGRLPQAGLVGGEMALDPAAAAQAIAPIADRLGISPQKAALGILGVVAANMVRAIRTITVEKGLNPAEYALMPFGGAGPLHAADVAEGLGIKRILVPNAPGLLCAQGLLVSDLKEEFVKTAMISEAGGADMAQELRARLAALSADVDAWRARQRIAASRWRMEMRLDMRFVGQNFEIPVVLPDGGAPQAEGAAWDEVKRAFLEGHERLYGFADAAAPVEVVNVRATLRAKLVDGELDLTSEVEASGAARIIARQLAYFPGAGEVETPVYRRASLQVDDKIDGPAIVSQFDATIVAPPAWTATVDVARNLVLEAR